MQESDINKLDGISPIYEVPKRIASKEVQKHVITQPKIYNLIETNGEFRSNEKIPNLQKFRGKKLFFKEV